MSNAQWDYDLVVIGSTKEGIYAARKAAVLKARVALVTQSDKDYLDTMGQLSSLCGSQVANYLADAERHTWGIYNFRRDLKQVSIDAIVEGTDLIKESIQAEDSLTSLALAGVDVVRGKGEFCRLPTQAFLVNSRQLTARNYLLATGANYVLPPELSQSDRFLTPEMIWQPSALSETKSIVTIGSSSRSIELAQTLARLGYSITYATPNKQLLPGESLAINRLFSAQLNSDGVKIFANSPLQQTKILDPDRLWLQLGQYKLETEKVIFANSLKPNITGLNLQGVGVKFHSKAIAVNEKLQTSNQAIYACGNLLGGYSLPHLAQYEVDIALKNMFAFPWFERDYSHVPIVMLTKPPLARIGSTKIAAEFREGEVFRIREQYKSLPTAQISGDTVGWCELIVKANGEIVSGTIVGDRAPELISIFALMMRRKIRLSANPIKGLLSQEIPHICFSYGELLNRIAIAFAEAKLKHNKSLRSRLANWFDWRK